MSTWIVLAILAQLISAITVFVDKYVLVHKEHVGKPIVYAFYISLLSGFVFVLIPFGVLSIPPLAILALAFLDSCLFVFGLISLYTALKEGHASDVVPVVGSISAIATAVCAYQWLAHDLPHSFIPAFGFMVLGMHLISRFRLTRRQQFFVLLAGLSFGIMAFTTKIILLHTVFLDGFFWTRAMNVVVALLLLTIPHFRKTIFKGYRGSSHGTRWLVVSNKALNGVATALTLLAISLGSVSIVQALTGLQFVFLVLFAYLFSSSFPKMLKGEFEKKGRTQKFIGIGCIVVGLVFLFAQ